MPNARRRKSIRPETMQRNAVISSFTPSMSLSIRGPTTRSPRPKGVHGWNFMEPWSNRSEMLRT